MTDSLKLAEMQRTSIEFERQRHLANWFIKSSPHMASSPPQPTSHPHHQSPVTAGANTTTTTVTGVGATTAAAAAAVANGATTSGGNSGSGTPSSSKQQQQQQQQQMMQHSGTYFLMSSNGNCSGHVVAPPPTHAEARKPKLRRFNSHDTSSNIFSVADFENARLARRNEIEMKQRQQRRQRLSANGNCGAMPVSSTVATSSSSTAAGASSSAAAVGQVTVGVMPGNMCIGGAYNGGLNGSNGFGGFGGDYSTGDSKLSKYSNESQQEPLSADIFLDRYELPCFARLSYKTKFSDETLQSSSSNGSSTVTSHSTSTATSDGVNNGSGAGDNVATVAGGTGPRTGTTTSSSTNSSSGGGGGGHHQNGGGGVRKPLMASHSASGILEGHHHNHSNNNNNNNNNNNHIQNHLSTNDQDQGELFLLYRLVRQRHIYHGHNAKTAVTNRKKGVLIPQEFPGYFSLLNDKGLPTATQYTSLIQLVRERVYKFVSVDNMPAFTESQQVNAASHSNTAGSPIIDGCLPLYSPSSSSATGGNTAAAISSSGGGGASPHNATNRPQYVKTTARGGQVFRLLAVFEDGKQDHHHGGGGGGGGVNSNGSGNGGVAIGSGCVSMGGMMMSNGNGVVGCGSAGIGGLKSNNSITHGREKEKGRYAQLLNENRQVLFVSLSTKGKFYEIEPGVPQILQKLGGGHANDPNKKVNPDCVHRITTLVTPNKELPQTIRYISGPSGCAQAIPENLCVTRVTTEMVMIACPIEDVDMQSPLHLRKLYLTREMQLLRSFLGFENEQRMLANPNVQNVLKFCQFNCDQFLKLVEVEVFHRSERSGSKSRVDGLKLLKPLHLPKLLRREKTTMATSSAHEKEDSIIFLTKSDLANLEAKEAGVDSSTHDTSASSGGGGGGGGLHSSRSGSVNRISEKMKVFQSTKKKWFRKPSKHSVTTSTSSSTSSTTTTSAPTMSIPSSSSSSATAAAVTLSALDLDVQAKRLSMERYTDMSKLLQERFGDNHNHSEKNADGPPSAGPSLRNGTEHDSASEVSIGCGSELGGCSDTETTTLATIEEKLKASINGGDSGATGGGADSLILQKSLSLQDIELIGGGRSGMLRRSPKNDCGASNTADTISEAGTDLDDLENRPPSLTSPQASFITEKLYNEFHVKTRQYSKSSSSLHQLMNFALPQKLQIHDSNPNANTNIGGSGGGGGAGSNINNNRRSLAQVKHNSAGSGDRQQPRSGGVGGEPITGRRAAGGLSLLAGGNHNGLHAVQQSTTNGMNSEAHSRHTSLTSPLTPGRNYIEDDLPYSSVRDSLVLSNEDLTGAGSNCDYMLTAPTVSNGVGGGCATLQEIDYTKENIYAEICHDAYANGAISQSHTRDTFSAETNSTQLSDDYGDYASLVYSTQAPTNPTATIATAITTNGGGGSMSVTANGVAISRVQINCSSSPVSYHTVYLGDEPLGEQHVNERRRRSANQQQYQQQQQQPQEPRRTSRNSRDSVTSRDRAHITTVALDGLDGDSSVACDLGRKRNCGTTTTTTTTATLEVDNIYNTLK